MSTSFKKRSRPSSQNRRIKRDDNGDEDEREEEDETTQIVKPQIRTIAPKTIQSTKALTTSEESNNGDENQGTSLAYSSTREIVPKKFAGDATHTIEVDTATDRSHLSST
jgi:hypothetical protein